MVAKPRLGATRWRVQARSHPATLASVTDDSPSTWKTAGQTAIVQGVSAAFLYGLAVLVAVGLCYLLRLENASRICAVAVPVITLIPRSEPAYLVAFHRFVEVCYGVACAVGYTLALDAARRRWRAHR